jgi:hypothetical protein
VERSLGLFASLCFGIGAQGFDSFVFRFGRDLLVHRNGRLFGDRFEYGFRRKRQFDVGGPAIAQGVGAARHVLVQLAILTADGLEVLGGMAEMLRDFAPVVVELLLDLLDLRTFADSPRMRSVASKNPSPPPAARRPTAPNTISIVSLMECPPRCAPRW